jgi:hypothetical protein
VICITFRCMLGTIPYNYVYIYMSDQKTYIKAYSHNIALLVLFVGTSFRMIDHWIKLLYVKFCNH